MKLLRSTVFTLAVLFGVSQSGAFAQLPKAPPTQTAPTKTADKAGAPSAQEVADAKAKGMVWVNLNTKVYHKDGRFYGTTKNGKFMTEADAQKAGYREAKEGAAAKKSTATSTAK